MVVQGWVTAKPGLIFNPLFWVMYSHTPFITQTTIYGEKICAKIFPSLQISSSEVTLTQGCANRLNNRFEVNVIFGEIMV